MKSERSIIGIIYAIIIVFAALGVIIGIKFLKKYTDDSKSASKTSSVGKTQEQESKDDPEENGSGNGENGQGGTSGETPGEGEHTQPQAKVKTFTRWHIVGEKWEVLDRVAYEEGMTWADWVNSEYNTIGAYLVTDQTYTTGDYVQYVDNAEYGYPVYMDFVSVILEDLTFRDPMLVASPDSSVWENVGMLSVGRAEETNGGSGQGGENGGQDNGGSGGNGYGGGGGSGI